MKKFFFLFLIPIFFSGCALINNGSQANKSLLNVSDHSIQSLLIDKKNIQVEVVNTAASTEQGLSGRSEIGQDGMLFVFNQTLIQRFWMKEMQFNLDLIWLRDLRVVDISENALKPSPGQSLQQLQIYSPKEPINGVLEVPAGTVQKWNVKRGDTFLLAQ